MRPAVRSLLGFALAHAGLCALVFLGISGFFRAWDGRAVSVRELKPDQAVARVLIVQDAGGTLEARWPMAAVEGLGLPVDRLALAPSPVPDALPRTHKARFTLGFTVSPAQGGLRQVPTTSPQGAAVAVLLFAVGLGLRNMVVAGSPLALQRPARPVPAGEGTAPVSRGPRGRKGPPPQRPRRGGGRRR